MGQQNYIKYNFYNNIVLDDLVGSFCRSNIFGFVFFTGLFPASKHISCRTVNVPSINFHLQKLITWSNAHLLQGSHLDKPRVLH